MQDAAKMLGVSWPALHDLVSKGAEPKLRTARRLAAFMGLSLDELAKRYDNADLSGILAPSAPIRTIADLAASGVYEPVAGQAVRRVAEPVVVPHRSVRQKKVR